MMGESFVETSEESAQEYLETLTEAAKKDVQVLVEEEEKLDNRQTVFESGHLITNHSHADLL